MADRNDAALREHLVKLLTEAQAHATFDEAVKGLDPELYGKVPKGAEHSQWDIVEFSRNEKHESPKWPEGYWPKEKAPADEKAWEKSVRAFKHDLKEMVELIRNEKTDLFAKIPHGDGQTVLREALLIADHNAYHVGQLVLVRRLLGAWG